MPITPVPAPVVEPTAVPNPLSAAGSVGSASRPSTRAIDTTARGIASNMKPTMRIGKASHPNSATAWTSWPGDTAPDSMRPAPTSRRAMVPRLGSMSIIGSKTEVIFATPRRSVRRWSAASANRAFSSASRPSVLTTNAPSKLSCAMDDTSPSRACTDAAGRWTRLV